PSWCGSVLELQVLFVEVEPDGLSAEGRELVDASLHADARALRRRTAAVRHDRDLARAVAHFVESDGHERHAPGAGDDAVDGHRAVLIAAGVVLDIGDLRVP